MFSMNDTLRADAFRAAVQTIITKQFIAMFSAKFSSSRIFFSLKLNFAFKSRFAEVFFAEF
jgi:hypothetical protein